MIEPHEQEIFGRYGLNPDAVHFLRARLACEPPYPVEELRAELARQEVVFERIRALQKETIAIMEQLAARGVFCTCWSGDENDGGPWIGPQEDFQWNIRDECWGEGPSVRGSGDDLSVRGDRTILRKEALPGPVLGEFAERPTRPDQLQAWNAFLVAFRSAPYRMFRVRGDGFYAAYRDSAGRFVYIPEKYIRIEPSQGIWADRL
jgi:hypothetical protein